MNQLFFKYFLVLLLTSNLTFSQKSKNELLALNIHNKAIENALKYDDLQTVIVNIHAILAIDENNLAYKDSLAKAYFKIGNFSSSFLLTKELLEVESNKEDLLRINAESIFKLGDIVKSINVYEKLFKVSNKMIDGYQLANLQFQIKRLIEAGITIDNTLKSVNDSTALYEFVFNDIKQVIPLEAIVYNLKGMILQDLNDNFNANEAFSKAFRIAPDFQLAKNNLKALSLILQK